MKLSKNSFYKSWAPKLIFSNEIFFRKIRIIFDIEKWLYQKIVFAKVGLLNWYSPMIFFLNLILLNSHFVWNWCNTNPVKITKSNHLWLRGFVSIILNLVLRVFAISAFLKVIHAHKTLKKPQERGYFRYPENNLPTYVFWNPCNRDFSWTIYSPPYHL